MSAPISQAQRRLMRAAASDPAIAARTEVPRSVAKASVAADTGRTLPRRNNAVTGVPNQFALPRSKR